MKPRIIPPLVLAGATLALAACGASAPAPVPGATSPSTTAPVVPATTAPTATTTGPPTSSAASAPVDPLVAEAQSAAAGDIPDNQVFLVYTNAAAGYTIKYPEGWAVSGSGGDVTIRDRSTVLHIVVATGAPPTASSVAAELAALAAGSASLKVLGAPAAVTVGTEPAVKAVYETVSDPSPVTGKRVTLVVDRYALAHAGNVMVVDLGTQKGVDNVDAFKLMIESVRWTS